MIREYKVTVETEDGDEPTTLEEIEDAVVGNFFVYETVTVKLVKQEQPVVINPS
jgi:hypothetical protein